jgi:CRP-like cAMP-binding protein
MLLDHLRRITALKGIAPSELRMLTRHVTVICVPPKRWLVQSRHRVDGYFFLLKGSLRTTSPSQVLHADEKAPLEYFYPGVDSAQTIEPVQIMRIDRARYEFLTAAAGADSPLARLDAAGWLQRFLASQMMRQLRPWQWQNLLKSCRREHVCAHACVVSAGEPGHECFVIERGHAIVRRGGITRSHLGPGDFFGEDALLLRGARNADVIALEDLWVHSIPQQAFNTILVDGLVRFVESHAEGVLLNVAREPVVGALSIDMQLLREEIRALNPKLSYYIVGGRLADRALCGFVMRQHGMVAYPVRGRQGLCGNGALLRPAAQ